MQRGWEYSHILHDSIVGGDAVSRNEEKGITAQLVDISDLSSGKEREGALEIGSSERHC